MSFISHAAKEINCKIVYYGAGLSGKTTNLKYILENTKPENRGQLVTSPGETERTLLFDFLPLNIGLIRGFKTRFHLCTIPGQHFYDASRKMVLRGVDGVVFVADSTVDRMEENLKSLKSLDVNLREHGYDMHHIPFVFQWNKRDVDQPVPVGTLREALNTFGAPEVEAVAVKGVGVFDTLKEISKLILASLRS